MLTQQFWDNLLSVAIIFALIVVGYCAVRKKDASDLWDEIKERMNKNE